MPSTVSRGSCAKRREQSGTTFAAAAAALVRSAKVDVACLAFLRWRRPMPFDTAVKTRMFVRCNRHCCLCLKHCGINIEAAHIIDEAAGGSNDEENGIPLCFDCHQEIGSYDDKHPRGNKIQPDELRERRDRVYALVADGRIDMLQPANLPRLL